MTFTPTDEQATALDLFRTGQSLAIEAGAGAGKTSTLQLLGNSTTARGQYLAFNKAIVTEAGSKMPGNVACSTAHSLAFRAVGRNMKHRLDAHRMKSQEIAKIIGIDRQSLVVRHGSQTKVLQPSYLAGLAMRAITTFCQTADDVPGERHVPYVEGIDLPTEAGKRTWKNNDEVRRMLAPLLPQMWRDLTDKGGRLPYKHEHYLKAWQLDRPTIHADFLLIDEAQDLSPVMLAIAAEQHHAQLVFVGDSQQQIYEFTGAVNALANVAATNRAFLTQSFRFGQPIADVANLILGTLNAELRLTGTDRVSSSVTPIDEPDVILSRTNASATSTLLRLTKSGKRVHLIGGGEDVLSFARAARDLKAQTRTYHPDLSCFETWGEVQDYVSNDPQGSDLKLLVDLMDDNDPDVVIDTLSRMPAERDADVVLSTAHKAKGREWDRVQLAGDFPDPDEKDVSDGEWRLLYVAATRARRELDVTGCGAISSLMRAEVESAAAPAAVAPVPVLVPAEAPSTSCPRCGTEGARSARTGIVSATHRCPIG
jgi:hypothetical protein